MRCGLSPRAALGALRAISSAARAGELPAGGVADEWGVVLAKDSPLTDRVSEAVDALRDDGTLAAITDEWLGAGQGVTLLQ